MSCHRRGRFFPWMLPRILRRYRTELSARHVTLPSCAGKFGMDCEVCVVVSVRSIRVNEQPCRCEVGGSGKTGCYHVVEGIILVLLQDGRGESEFGSKGEAFVGGLRLSIYCRYSTTHLVDVLACGFSQYLLQRLRIQHLRVHVLCRHHGGVLFLFVDYD